MAFSALEKALAIAVGIDLAVPGTNRKVALALARQIPRVSPPVARGAMGVSRAALGGGAALARRNPYAATGLGALAAYEAGLLEPLYEPFEQGVRAVDEAIVQAPARRRKKQRTAFNRAVSEGMKAVKKSTSYGKKGTINNARKAFTAVTKVASKLNKGKKVSPKGPTGVIKKAINRFFPKKKPVRRRGSGKVNYSITVNKK